MYILYNQFPITLQRGTTIPFSGYGERWVRICMISEYSYISPIYWVSSYARFYSELNGFLTKTVSFDYEYIMLRGSDSKAYRIRVHRIVQCAFYPIYDSDSYEVNHINGKKRENGSWNTEWSTRKENMGHAVSNGLAKSCQDSYRATIDNDTAIKICELLSTGDYLCNEIAEHIGCSIEVVQAIKARKSWNTISKNYIFRTKVSRTYPNRILEKILDFMERNDISDFESKNEYFREALSYAGWDSDGVIMERTLLRNIYQDIDGYRHKLNNCIC